MTISRTWTLTKTNYYTDFVVAAKLVVISIILFGFNPLWFAAGLVLWSLTEYFTHRFLFHRVFRKEHWQHHSRETDYVGVSSYKTVPVLLVLFGIAYISNTMPLYQGVVFGYWLYIVAHDAIHHPNWLTKLMPNKDGHIRHHRYADEINFGVTTAVWDHVFGTYVD